MPFIRLVPVLLPAAAFLVLATAQRMALLFLLHSGLHPSWGDAAAALGHGARIDLACAAVIAAPFSAWCSALPERAWSSKAHRRLAGGAFALAIVAVITFLACDALQFFVNHARLSHPIRERLLVAWRLLAGGSGGLGELKLGIVLAVACLATGIAVAMLLRRAFRSAWSEKAAPLVRARDFVLALGVLVLAVALAPRAAPFAGSPVLGEIASSSVPAVARAAWRRAAPRLATVSSRTCTSRSSAQPARSREAGPGSTRARPKS